MLFSFVSNIDAATDCIDLFILNKDTGSNKIADIGHAKIYVYPGKWQTFDIKKGERLNVKFKPFDGEIANFDTGTGHAADLNLRHYPNEYRTISWKNLPDYIGNLSINVEVRQFNGRTGYNNKIDYVRINSDKLGEVLKVGSPSILDYQHVFLSIESRHSQYCFHLNAYDRMVFGYPWTEIDVDGPWFNYPT